MKATVFIEDAAYVSIEGLCCLVFWVSAHRRSQDLERGVVFSKIPDFHGQFKKKFW
jgi:hypothetical protein